MYVFTHEDRKSAPPHFPPSGFSSSGVEEEGRSKEMDKVFFFTGCGIAFSSYIQFRLFVLIPLNW